MVYKDVPARYRFILEFREGTINGMTVNLRKSASNALEILAHKFGNDPDTQERIAEERVEIRAAQGMYDARKAAGLTQRALAEVVGKQQPVIARLEDAHYEGHTLSVLDRIAKALNMRMEIRFVPNGGDNEETADARPARASVPGIGRSTVRRSTIKKSAPRPKKDREGAAFG
jgi:ribosome-binding protein aMBF1 (putative translation factor)